MPSSQASILRRTLSREKFEQLCNLWDQMLETSQQEGHEAVIITEEDIFSNSATESSDSPREKERLSVLVTQEFSAFLLGIPNLQDTSVYQVTITVEPEAIATIIKQLEEPLDHNPKLRKRLKQINLGQLPTETHLQNQFTIQLLEILLPEVVIEANPEKPVYPNFNRQPVNQVLQHQLEQERILNQVTVQISQNLDWLLIVKMTIEQVQRLLKLDRLVVYQLGVEINSSTSGVKQAVDTVTYEAKASDQILSILHFQDESCFSGFPECRDKYRQGFSLAIDDVEISTLSPCLLSLMRRLQIRAKLVTPIIVQGNLWGFLIGHQCLAPRHWTENDIQFLRYVAEYLAIAIYQAKSYKQLQGQKKRLEFQVNQRAQELKDALLVAQAAHQFKSEFLDNMTHELRTPLTCVIGLSNTLLHWSGEKNALPLEKQQKYLATIQESGKKLLELIDDLLDFSQIKAGKSVLNIREFSLRHLSRLIIHNLKEGASTHQINLELELEVEANSDRFYSDPERIEQILMHLLDNGLKFTPIHGTVTLRVWREQNQAIFQVEDNGIGISEQNLPSLFDKFQPLENPRIRTYRGAALGLALTKQLVELLGGTIIVDSSLGKGSAFTVHIPNQTDTMARFNSLNRRGGLSITHKGTIVLIEQDEEIATLICELLIAANYQLIWLVDGSTALEQMEVLEPVMIIVNQDLPDIYEVSQSLKSIKSLSDVKILVLSNQMGARDWDYLSQKIIDDYIAKPIDPGLLLQKINALENPDHEV